MIVTILKSGSTFNGIDYNSEKVRKGVAEFLGAGNLGLANLAMDFSPKDQKNTLEMVCSANKRVKNKQFHVAISCKGNEYNCEQLKEIGIEYLRKMGYSNSPYFMYFHKDTDNNHIHIVASRIDNNGNKVSDKYEKIRSQDVMNQIMNVNLKQEAKEIVNYAMEYNFSTIAQFKLLVELKGWGSREKDNKIQIIKSGKIQHSFNKDDLMQKIAFYKQDKSRTNQIAAIINKYSKGLTPLELKKQMKDNFGIELIFHTGNEHAKPYGYTILDHNNKNLFKGSEVYPLSKILSNKEVYQRLEAIKEVLNILLNKHEQSYKKLKEDIKPYHLQLKGKSIYLQGIKQPVYKLSDDIYKQIRYIDRKDEANLFNIANKQEVLIIAKLYFVKPQDLRINPMAHKKDYLQSEISSIVGNQKNINNSNWAFITFKDSCYLIDKRNKDITNVSEFYNYINTESRIINQTSINGVGESLMLSDRYNFIDALFDIFNQDYGQGEQDNKKKRKRNMNHN